MKTINILAAFLLGISCMAPASTVSEIPLKYGAWQEGKRQDAAMKKFRENRLGQFIHWGLFAVAGGEWKGKIYGGASEFLPKSAGIPMKEWEQLMPQFNPVKFNPRQWAKMAKDAGFKYVTITTKHHDGFCLWPSAYTDFTVANTPYKNDLIGPLVEAYNAEGIDVYLYFSVLDWHHPDWRPVIKTEEDRAAMGRFFEFTANQIRELATTYPSVKGFWFDGTWDQSIKSNGKWSYDIEMMLKKLIPGCIVNSRLRADERGARHFDSNKKLMGDYESGYERKLPDPVLDAAKVSQVDWESCMTIPENIWGYHKDWSMSYVKKPIEFLDWILHSVSMGGNILVNFGPTPQGDFRTEEKQLAEYIGRWMAANGEAVYGCDYAGWKKQDWGYYTKKGSRIYMTVFNRPLSNMLKVATPGGIKPVRANLMINGKASTAFDIIETTRNQYHIMLKGDIPDQPFVIILEVDVNRDGSDKYQKALT